MSCSSGAGLRVDRHVVICAEPHTPQTEPAFLPRTILEQAPNGKIVTAYISETAKRKRRIQSSA